MKPFTCIILSLIYISTSSATELRFAFKSHNNYKHVEWIPFDEKKPVFLFFGSEHCHFSQNQLELIQSNTITDYLNRNYAYKIYLNPQSEKAKYKTFRVNAFPTMIFVNPAGNIYSYGTQAKNATEMLNMLADNLNMTEALPSSSLERKLSMLLKWGEYKRFFTLLKQVFKELSPEYQLYFKSEGYWNTGNRALARYYHLKMLHNYPTSWTYSHTIQNYCNRYHTTPDKQLRFLNSEIHKENTNKQELIILAGAIVDENTNLPESSYSMFLQEADKLDFDEAVSWAQAKLYKANKQCTKINKLIKEISPASPYLNAIKTELRQCFE
jgi:hypothetical protein